MADEVRLIDAIALERSIQEQIGKCMIKVFDPSVNLILQDIRNAPTIEAEPVKHGRWEARTQKDGTTIGQHNVTYCSECGYVLFTKEDSFCARCGAKMDVIYQDDKIKAVKVVGWEEEK